MRRPHRVLVAIIGVLLASNTLVSALLGLGDAEALYYCYARYLSGSYMDHPPLIGWLIAVPVTLLGPHPLAVRLVPMTMSALSLIFIFLLTRDLYGKRAAAWSSIIMLATPVFSVGMTAAAPDAPMVAIWSFFTWQMHRLITKPTDGLWQKWIRPLILGITLGLGFLSKYTAIGLAVTTIIIVAQKEQRIWLTRPVFYLSAFVTAGMTIPIFHWNHTHDWAGLFHRLVWTQEAAGFSLRNLGALIGGQLLYVGPLMLAIFFLAIKTPAMSSVETRGKHLLLAASLPTLALTYLLVVWSRVAEPHWPAVGYVPLFPLAAGYVATTNGRTGLLARWAVGLGVVVFLALHLVVLTPLVPVLTPENTYEPKYDLANELRGWPEVADAIRKKNRTGRPVIAAFYTQCSQLTFALNRPSDPPVRCISKETDDFDIWHGAFEIPHQGALFVTDNRFKHNIGELLPGVIKKDAIRVPITRAGQVVREFQIIPIRSQNADERDKNKQ